MAAFKIVVHHAAVDELLRRTIVPDLTARADRIEAAAGDGMVAEVHVGAHRARATIRTATFRARTAEARDRVLTKALDAGR